MNGHPGSGKTTLGEHLSKQLSIALVSKDGIKERLFDTLGCSDRPLVPKARRGGERDALGRWREAFCESGRP